MKRIFTVVATLLVLLLLVFYSCRKDHDIVAGNKPPVARAGIDQVSILPRDSIVLDGSNSMDPEGVVGSYRWSKIAGPSAGVIVSPSSAVTVVRSLVEGIYRFELRVTDNVGLSSRDTVQVTVSTGNGTNYPPVVYAGPDQDLYLPAHSCTLNGSVSYDPDGMIASYRWTKVAGPSSSTIEVPAAVTTQVSNLSVGVYHFELQATDDKGASAKDTVQVTLHTENRPPVADAGPDQTIVLPKDYCTLNGNASNDPDGRITAYRWAKVAGPSGYTIYYPDRAQTNVGDLSEGVYRFELLVTDNEGLTGKDTVQVRVDFGTQACDISSRGEVRPLFTQVGQLSKARIPAVGAANNKIVFAGGPYYIGGTYSISDVVDIYDPATQQWTTAQLSRARETIPTVSCGDKIFFAGGNTIWDMVVDNVDIYDATHNTWTLAHLSVARGGIATAVVGSKVFFAGGYMEGIPGSKQVDIYDTAAKRWSTAQLSEARADMGAVTVGNKIYFAGGSGQNESNKIDIYNDQDGSWSTSSLKELSGPLTGAVAGNYIYWAGVGENSSKVEAQYIGSNNNPTVTCLSFPRYMSALVVHDNNIIFSTSRDWNNSYYLLRDRFDVYNTSSGTWKIGYFNQPVTAPALISVNHKLYMGGGKIGATTCTDKVYLVTMN